MRFVEHGIDMPVVYSVCYWLTRGQLQPNTCKWSPLFICVFLSRGQTQWTISGQCSLWQTAHKFSKSTFDQQSTFYFWQLWHYRIYKSDISWTNPQHSKRFGFFTRIDELCPSKSAAWAIFYFKETTECRHESIRIVENALNFKLNWTLVNCEQFELECSIVFFHYKNKNSR
jgi:hypothetical protein